jgi:AraC family transcriptional regulator
VPEPGHGSSAKRGANADSKRVGEDNPIWRFPGFRIEAKRSWGLISADIVSRDAGEATWLSDRHRIVHALTDIPGSIQSDGRAADKYGLYREKIAFRPAEQMVRSDLQSPVRFIQILQSPDTYENFVGDLVRGGAVSLEPRANVDDPLISRIALSIVGDMEGGFLDHVLADALNTALAVRIVRLFVDPPAINLAPSNGLSRERLRRVCDYIEEHLDDRLTLTEIAGVACLSPYHFSRSFKQAVGVPPRRYIIQRRVERAKTLLRRTNRPVSWVAQEAGFADQSHLTAEFRRQIGVTPGRFRTASTGRKSARST